MEIRFGKWRLRPYDRRNWTLDEWRSPTSGKNRGGEPQWNHRDEYYQSLPQALGRVLEYELRDEPGAYDTTQLQEFLDKVAEVCDRVCDVRVEA